ncbi:MAG: OmpA family protein [Saprospiraceae bacterium]|nr:OmpA family protein [Saprospiraceae bacterium]
MRLIPIIILAILWLLFGIYFVKPCFETACGCTTTTATSAVDNSKKDAPATLTPSATKVSGPLLFNWDKAAAVTDDGWDARRKAILDGLKDDEVLEIIGNYRADEVNNTSFENLGLARATEVANLFKPPLTDDRIQLKGQLVKEESADRTSSFKSIEFNELKNSKAIKEIDDKTLIYFPFNSVNKLSNTEIESYLNDVAERVIKTGERVRLTGHTDNIDSEAFNKTLGMRRANIVKDYLVSKGVSPSKIIASSQGETKPIATNNTSDGRAKNRRTELEIIK